MPIADTITIQVKPGSRLTSIEKLADGSYTIKVREQAINGKATTAAIKALAKEIGLPKSSLSLLHGKTSRHKVISIRP